jgi:hypothetical protein
MTAVNKNNTKEVESLINSGVDVNKKSLGATPLYTAVWRNNIDIVSLLLDKEANVNEKGTTSGWRPIHMAIKNKNAEILKLLIEKGVDISIPNPLGKTPMTMAIENGSTDIINLLNGEEVNTNEPLSIKSDTTTTSIVNSAGQVPSNTKKEDIFTPGLRIVKPIPSYIPETALSNPGRPSSIKDNYGKISSLGFGIVIDAKVYKELHLLFDMTGYNFKQELVEKLGIGHANIGIGYDISLPLGAKYKTYTTAMRLGVKYVYSKNQTFQPWIGLAYGLNVWSVKYITWDEDEIYGKANGITWRSSILFGIDMKLKDIATFTFFFDAISPVANYTIETLFGLGDFHQFDAMTFPTPRIGLSIGGF